MHRLHGLGSLQIEDDIGIFQQSRFLCQNLIVVVQQATPAEIANDRLNPIVRLSSKGFVL